MSDKNKKSFGVWMDAHNATIVGKEDGGNEEFVVLGHVKNAGSDNNSNGENSFELNNSSILKLTELYKLQKESNKIFDKTQELNENNVNVFSKQNLKLIYRTRRKKSNLFVNLNNRRLLRTKRILVVPSNINITLITNSFDVVHS